MTKMDSEDEFKRRMRRRLVGAVALVTALVVILPMLLENSPRRREGSLELRIPDKDKSGAFSSQMVVAESAPDVTPLPAPGSAQEQMPASAAPAAAPQQAAPARTLAPQAQPARPEAAHQAKPEHKAAESRPDTHKAEAHKAGFAVQVGAFSRASAAKDLQDRLSKQGWHAYTQKAGSAVRVRVGPYSGRADAEKAQRQLAAQGVHPAAVVAEP